jgi:hypothetical protein
MEETNSFETTVDLQWTTRLYVQEYKSPYNQRCYNLKSYKMAASYYRQSIT